MEEKGYSQCRPCGLVDIDRRVYRYRSTPPSDAELRGRLKELASQRRRTLRSGARFGLLSRSSSIPLCGLEHGALPEHRMHDDGQAAGKRDPRLAHGGALGDRQRPILQLQRPSVTRQHDVGRFIEQRSHPPVTTF